MPTPAELSPGGAGRGVIHDIGYRHYDGPRLGRGYITRSLFAESARGAYGLGRSARSKVVPMLLLVAMCLPALISVVIAGVTGAPELPIGYAAYVINLQVLIAIYVAAQAPVCVSRDLRFRVMPLYFSRPLGRVDYVLAKYGALAAAVFLFLALPLVILFIGALLAKMPVGEQVPDFLRALAGAVLCALLVGGLGLVVAAITPRRGLGVAAIIAVLLVLAGVQGAVQGIALEQQHTSVAAYAGLISPFTLVEGVQSGLLGAPTGLPAGPSGTAAGLVFLLVGLLAVAGSFGVLLLRYRRVSI